MSVKDASEKMVDIGDNQLRTFCIGEGTPTVIIEAGLGDGLDSWKHMQNRIATLTRVFAYDRAGVGKSPQGTKPRTSHQMVTELHTLLKKAQIEGPYVLIGHSLGGLNAQLYAAEYPDEISGMVLADPSFPDMLSRLESVLGKVWMLLWNSQFASAAEGMTKKDFDMSCAQVASAGKLPDIPLVVISAGQSIQLPSILNALFPGAEMVRALQESHAALAKASSNGKHLIAEKSTHATIYQDDLILDSIRQIVGTVRSGA
jgi:pimeloyl-ACP methyl ester carboxylesterase